MELFKRRIAVWAVLSFLWGTLFPTGAGAISIAEEEELSREVMDIVARQFEIIKDPLITAYVNKLGQKILAVLPPQPFTYHFYVIKEDVYNAFATPGGHIFINSGLLAATETEAELIGIIAHEIAHVQCRHISQKIERSKKVSLATLAGVAAGVLLGVGGAGAAASAITIGSMAAGQSVMLAYSREDEMQADQIGLKSLAEAGYGAEGLLDILKKMRNRQWFGKEQIPTYLMTHPASEDRMAYIGAWIETHGLTTKPPAPAEAEAFRQVRTKLIAEYGDESVALRAFQAELQRNPDDPLANYGYGLLLERTGNRSKAIAHLRKALERRAFDAEILQELGRVYFLGGQFQEALYTLEGVVGDPANNPLGAFFLGRTQSELGRLREARATFEQLLEHHPDYTQGYYFLGETYSKLSQPAFAHYNLGIYYKSRWEMKNAEFHLIKARQMINDSDKQTKIDEMLKEIRKEPPRPSK